MHSHLVICNIFLQIIGVVVLSSYVFGDNYMGINSSTKNLHFYDWKVQYTNVTRLCRNNSIVTINGEYPGPTIAMQEDDMVIVRVTNLVDYNVTIHWHGIKQFGSGWADGVPYVTQCPIQKGASYEYRFKVRGQTGTYFWHAHTTWLRATLHGAFIIYPKSSKFYPISQYVKDVHPPILLGEWWIRNVEDVLTEALEEGGPYTPSDALTINGQPGYLYDCSMNGAFSLAVEANQTYLLRIINVALNFQLFFSINAHSFIVVEIDGEYVQQVETNTIHLTPGQTTTVLLTTNQPIGQFYMAASVFSPVPPIFVAFPNISTVATIKYFNSTSMSKATLPHLPAYNDINYVNGYLSTLKSLVPDVPKGVDRNLFFAISYAMRDCPLHHTCPGPYHGHLSSAINNVTFQFPTTTSILQAYYYNIPDVYDTNFPDNPPFQYDYTRIQISNMHSVLGTKVSVLEYNSHVQLVLQDTRQLFFESHPFHLHGYSFYLVGWGYGTYDPKLSPRTFNLHDPPKRNTIAVPLGGWSVIRFKANNPGVWFFHCHFDMHQSWGMATVFLVKGGPKIPPPQDLPKC